MSWTKQQIDFVWTKARRVNGYDPNVKRLDKCGALIARSAHGDHNSKYGWDIDHIYPVSKGGTDESRNLQPLHWKNNQGKGDGPDNPLKYCVIKG